MHWLIERTHYLYLLAATFLLLVIGVIAVKNNQAQVSKILMQRYLEILPSVSLEMVKTQSALEAYDGRVLAPVHVDMLETSLTKLLSNQYPHFEKDRLAMKIEIFKGMNTFAQTYNQELHRIGENECEPEQQLVRQMELHHSSHSDHPHYQVTLCYFNADGSIMTSSASSINLAQNR